MTARKFEIELIGEIFHPDNDNIDVFVRFDNGEEFVGSFFTLNNIQELMKQKNLSRENVNGLYFWSSDLIIIEELSEENIELSIYDMLKEGGFYSAFSPTNKLAYDRVQKEAPVSLNDN
ncbi:hypothetical protein [Ekhidna sp.]|uniref:hypothetical protein n=1 Tax=Ekhidna sp. TaxID=2608089 RepID=UPI00329A5F7A